MAKLILMHGFIGSGKTTFSRKIESEMGAIRFTHDEWMDTLYGNNPPVDLFQTYYGRVQTLILDLGERLLRRGQDIILDFGFWSRDSRDTMRQWGQNIGAEVILYSIECDIAVMRERTRKRTQDAPKGTLFIDDNAFTVLYKKFEPLHPEEERITVNTSHETLGVMNDTH